MTTRPALFLFVASLGGAGCLSMLSPQPEPETRFEPPTYQRMTPDRSPTTPGDITVYTMHNLDDLPDGVKLVHADHVEVASGFPNDQDPHAVLGVIRLTTQKTDGRRRARRNETQKQMLERIGRVQQRAQDLILQEAARRGANAVFVRHGSGGWGAQALYISNADAVYPPVSEVLAQVETPDGYKRVSKKTETLDSYEPIRINAKRQKCYAVVLAMHDDAHLAKHTRNGLYLHVDGADKDISMISFATPVFGEKRHHVQTIGCPTVNGALNVKLQPSPNRSGNEDLGAGGVTVEVYSKSISAKELDDMVQARKENWRRTRLDNCEHCYYLRVRCGKDDERDCPKYLTCLRKRGETPQTCRALR